MFYLLSKLFSFMESYLFTLVFGACAFGVLSKKSLLNSCQGPLFPLFSSRSLTVSGLDQSECSLVLPGNLVVLAGG